MSDTHVVGFFNPNSYPIQISVSKLGQTYTLRPGEYITASDPSTGKSVKVNDPIFETYCGPMRLSKEVLKDRKVPFVRILSQSERGNVPAIQAAAIEPRPDGKMFTPTIVPAKDTNGPASPVRAMSMEEAIKAGLIARPRIKQSSAPKETDGAPLRGESIPELEYDDADVRNYRPNSRVDAIDRNPTVLTVPSRGEIATPPVPQQVPTDERLPSVPLPTLEDVEESLQSKDSSLSFVCDLDTPPTAFQFRSQLVAYLKRVHPHQVDTYMKRYPKKK